MALPFQFLTRYPKPDLGEFGSANRASNLTEVKAPVGKVRVSAAVMHQEGGVRKKKRKEKCVLVSVSTSRLPAGVKLSLMTANEEVRGVSACE